MRYRVVKDTKSDPKRCAFIVLPFGDDEADKFAETLVKMHEGSVKEFDSYAELESFLVPRRKGGDIVYAYNGPNKIITFDIGDFGEEVLAKCFAGPKAATEPAPAAQPAVQPAQPPAAQPAKTSEPLRCVRLARGLVEDMVRCKYGVSISAIAETALAYLNAAENAINAETGKE